MTKRVSLLHTNRAGNWQEIRASTEAGTDLGGRRGLEAGKLRSSFRGDFVRQA